MTLLTPREKRLLEAIGRSRNVKQAIESLNRSMNPSVKDDITLQAAYQTLYRIRERYKEARQFVNEVVALRKKYPNLDNRLAPKTLASRIRVEDEQEEKEEEEEGRR